MTSPRPSIWSVWSAEGEVIRGGTAAALEGSRGEGIDGASLEGARLRIARGLLDDLSLGLRQRPTLHHGHSNGESDTKGHDYRSDGEGSISGNGSGGTSRRGSGTATSSTSRTSDRRYGIVLLFAKSAKNRLLQKFVHAHFAFVECALHRARAELSHVLAAWGSHDQAYNLGQTMRRLARSGSDIPPSHLQLQDDRRMVAVAEGIQRYAGSPLNL
jgi:hypothetical protein